MKKIIFMLMILLILTIGYATAIIISANNSKWINRINETLNIDISKTVDDLSLGNNIMVKGIYRFGERLVVIWGNQTKNITSIINKNEMENLTNIPSKNFNKIPEWSLR